MLDEIFKNKNLNESIPVSNRHAKSPICNNLQTNVLNNNDISQYFNAITGRTGNNAQFPNIHTDDDKNFNDMNFLRSLSKESIRRAHIINTSNNLEGLKKVETE